MTTVSQASTRLAHSIEWQKEKGGPNYREWEDSLDIAIEEFAKALIAEIVQGVVKELRA